MTAKRTPRINSKKTRSARTPEQRRRDEAMLRRLDTLLTKHDPELYADWKRRMDEHPWTHARSVRVEVASRLIVAVFTLTAHRYPEFLDTMVAEDDGDRLGLYFNGTDKVLRTARRNERLLVRLVVRGCHRRGELA